MPGPPPLSIAQLKTRNSWRAAARIKKGYLNPSVSMPSTPKFLGKEERKAFRKLCATLFELQILHRVDEFALGRYASLKCRWISLNEQLRNAPSTLEDAKGRVYLNPIFSLEGQISLALSNFERQFGLTPAARSGIRIELEKKLKEQKDPKEAKFFPGENDNA